MYSLLVLGIVPGTDFRITFSGWLIAVGTLIGSRLLLVARRRKALAWLRLVIAFYLLPLRAMRIHPAKA